jgi:2-haloacid dehalogenase
MRYKWLLLDADGTLFDYDRAEARALERTFTELGCGYEPRYAETYRRINGEIWHEFEQGKISQARLRTRRFELLFRTLQLECDPEIFSARYLKALAEGSELMDGAEEVVRALHGKVGLVIITNGLQEVQRARFANSAISDCFAEIVISEEVGAAKPDKEIFDVAFERMNQPRKEDVLIVGDSLSSDIRGGNIYGIDTCWYNAGQKPRELDVEVDYEIMDLAELLSLVDGARGRGALGARDDGQR